MPPLPSFLNYKHNRAAWHSAALVSVLMATWFAATIDAQAFWDAINSVPVGVLLGAIMCLVVNSMLDGYWLATMTGDRNLTANAYRVVAWHMLLSSILPARMGDLGWIYFIHRWLEMPAARAIFVALYHRLQDFIVVSLMFALSIAAARVEIIGANFAFSAVGILLLMCLVWAFLPRMLGMLGACLWILHRRFGNRMLKAALRQVLRVRIWYRHGLTRRQVVVTFTVIAVRQASVTGFLLRLLINLVHVALWLGIIGTLRIAHFRITRNGIARQR